ncbi:hypothetical protein [Desulfovibrio ferrophilus]|uniref:Uncharacterized protein n=1 Tax=Desulfovibrio ferrophilus TaxID=241368 RepID=A0A2Z6AXX4_9BACT|nr:hypothetical protein [Desulfovibrio ferrophilus]BBD08055.1 uncharacterized protein DFE_1329 [Desulfovibrio ferrophilus]
MESIVILLLAAGMGLVSVEMFGRTWLGFLGLIAAAFLKSNGSISSRTFAGRMHESLLQLLLCGGLLLLAFTVYVRLLGLGFSKPEMVFYLIAAVIRLTTFIRSLEQSIDDMFETD